MFQKRVIVFSFIIFVDFYSCIFLPIGNLTYWEYERVLLNDENNVTVPEYFDWREQGAVSSVKDQGGCPACWAFSIIANIESQMKITHNQEVSLSEQFLIDCIEFNEGCTNGSVLKTLAHIVSVLSGVLEEKYYYSYSEHQQKCRWDGDPSKLVPVVGYKRVKPDENVMKENLFKNGPLIAAINSKSMGTYTEGIDEPTDEQCDPEELNHSVLIVGYGVTVTPERNVSYWIIKNSWGGDFGDKGFYYLVRGRNACGIASDVSYTFVD